MSLRNIDGFEHGVLSTAGGGLYSAIVEFGTPADIVTSPVRTGGRALRLQNSSRFTYAISGTPTVAMVGGWVRFTSLPADPLGVDIFGIAFASGQGVAYLGVVPSGQVRIEGIDGVGSTLGASGGLIVPGVWHWVQLYADVSSTPRVLKARVDEIEVTHSPASLPTTIVDAQLWGNSFFETGDLERYYDDVVVYAGSLGDYPISPKRIRPRRPNGSGAHDLDASPSAWMFKEVAGTETLLTTAETTSHETIDDSPFDADADHVGIHPGSVGFGTSAESHTGTTGSTSQASFDWTIALAAGCRGVLVFTFVANASGDLATSVKINPASNNIDVPAVAGGRAADTATEPGDCKAWFVGSGLAAVAGTTVTMRVNRTNNASVMYAVAVTVLADGDLEATGVVLLQEDGTLAVQSVTDGNQPYASYRFAGLYTGLAAPPAAGTGSTVLQSIDLGAFGCSVVRESTNGTGARNVGFSSGTSDDRAAVHLAIRGKTPQVANTDYLAHDLENTGEAELPLAAKVIWAMAQDAANTCAIDGRIHDGTSETTLLDDYNINSASVVYQSAVPTTKPSGGAWTREALDALKSRWGFTANASGTPRLGGLLVETLHDDTPSVTDIVVGQRAPLILPPPRLT